MIAFLSENLSTIVIGLILIVSILLIIIGIIKSKKRGKSSCGCGCLDCPYSNSCSKKP